MIKADLHVHSRVSDGSNLIPDILLRAQRQGLTHISLTDHDTTYGLEQAAALGKQLGITVIPGVEFSAFDYKNKVRTHILGYGMKSMEPIERLGSELLERRHQNSLKQIKVLQKLGYDITVEEVAQKAGRHIYKQHIMHVMMEKGYTAAIGGETFRKLFKNGGPCDFDIQYLDVLDAIGAIREAGGISSLAHPGQQGNFGSIAALKGAGLNALELYHHSNTAYDRARITEHSHCYGLLLTGGSDHHGLYENNSPEVGDYTCPVHTMEYLMEAGIC